MLHTLLAHTPRVRENTSINVSITITTASLQSMSMLVGAMLCTNPMPAQGTATNMTITHMAAIPMATMLTTIMRMSRARMKTITSTHTVGHVVIIMIMVTLMPTITTSTAQVAVAGLAARGQ